MKPDEVNATVIRVLAQAAGLVIPDEDIEPLISAFKNHLAGMEALESLNLGEHDPIVVFNPLWL